jgi:hypothetical protein
MLFRKYDYRDHGRRELRFAMDEIKGNDSGIHEDCFQNETYPRPKSFLVYFHMLNIVSEACSVRAEGTKYPHLQKLPRKKHEWDFAIRPTYPQSKKIARIALDHVLHCLSTRLKGHHWLPEGNPRSNTS